MQPPHISTGLKIAMFAAFFAILGAWSWIWSTFVHSLPMWGVYSILAAMLTFAVPVVVRDQLRARRQKLRGTSLSRRAD